MFLRSTLRHVAVALWALVACVQAAEAKLVAIVFDTSRSMEPYYQLPSFGMELLAATIDGRVGFDRLWTLNFNYFTDNCSYVVPGSVTRAQMNCDMSGQVRKFDVTDQGQHQSMVNSFSRDFAPLASGTPYAPLEIMLDEIAAGASDGEEVVLVVVSDGLYHQSDTGTDFDGGVYIPQMQQSFAALREKIAARGVTLSVEYLFIDASGGAEAKVREQGVRDTLLQVFNGDQAKGAWHVTGKDRLWDALTQIIARVSGTDREAQRPFITYGGSKIAVQTPLSISRLVIVSTGQVGRPMPGLVSDAFGGKSWTESRQVTADMPGQDPAFAGVQLQGSVRQLLFQNPVPAGRHELEFDAPVDQDVFLLFETSAITDLRLFDATGTEVLPDANGDHVLYLGQSYEFRSQILDGIVAPQAVDLDALPPSLAMYLTLSDAAGDQVQTMALDKVADEGRFGWTPANIGASTAFSRAAAGILSPQSQPMKIVVLDAKATLTVSDLIPDATCTTCVAGEVASPITVNGTGSVRIGRFEVTADAAIPGQINLGDTNLPPGYELRRPDGSVVDPSQPLDMGADETVVLEVWRPTAVSSDDLVKGTSEISISAAPAGAWSGPATVRPTTVRLSPPGMSMKLIAATQSPTPGKVDGLLVPGGELVRGQFSAQFGLTDLVIAPDPALIDDLVRVEATGLTSWLVAFDASVPDPVATRFHALDVRPKTSYPCLCFLGVGNWITGTVARDATVTYEQQINGVVIQTATAPLLLHFPVAIQQMSISCLLDLLIALLVVMILRGIVALFRTNRFPRGSVVEIAEGNAVPRFKRLDKGNSFWWKAWFALFTGDPDEVRTIEGLRIKATRRGGMVDVTRAAPPWTVDRLGESFAQMKENNPKKTEYALLWGDRLENTHRPSLSLRLKRRSSDT